MDKLKELLDQFNFPPELIFNMDETMLEVGENRTCVITKPSSPRPSVDKAAKAEHISLVLCVSACGGYARPLCIFPLKTLPELNERTNQFYYISGQPNGFITKEIFFGWMTTIIIPAINQTRQQLGIPNQKALLLVDPHSTRDHQPSLQACEQNNICVYSLLSHSSTISQPLDLTCNGEFKRVLTKYFRPLPNETKPDKRIRLLDCSVKALQIALAGIHVEAGFARAGIWPYSRDAPLKSSLVRDPINTPIPPRLGKRKRGPKIAGRILAQGKDITPALPAPTPAPVLRLGNCPVYPAVLDAPSQEESNNVSGDYIVQLVE